MRASRRWMATSFETCGVCPTGSEETTHSPSITGVEFYEEGDDAMNATEQEYTQPLGLDVGTSRIVVARSADKRYAYTSQLNAFLVLPHSKLTESLLEREKVFYEV